MRNRSEEIDNLLETLEGGRRRKREADLNKSCFVALLHATAFCARAVELTLAAGFYVLATAPVFAVLCLRYLATRRPIFEKAVVFGAAGAPLELRYFNCRKYYLRNASLFHYALTGKLSLVGVGIKPFDRTTRFSGDNYLYAGKPGIFNLLFVRGSVKIAHEGERNIEWEYVFRKNVLSDFVLILKSLPSALYRCERVSPAEKINLFGAEFMNITMNGALTLIADAVKSSLKKKIFFVNADCLNTVFKDKEYFAALKSADHVFPDGIGVNIGCRLIGSPLRENVNGTDMLPFLCAMMAERGYSLYLLGAAPGVAATMRRNLEQRHPGLRVVGERDGFFDHATGSGEVVEQVNAARPDVLLVGFGAPRQEKWIVAHAAELACHVVMGVGGLFDFYSGRIRRAPRWVRELGLEWVFRLAMEPGRMWRRYIIGNPLFIYRVLKWKLHELKG